MIEKIAVETERQREAAEKIRKAYASRIEELRGYVLEDEIDIREESEQDFWAFVESLPSSRQANLVLCDNGNLKAVWRDGKGALFGIQFMGNGQGEYVIFKRRQGSTQTSRVAGIDAFQGIKNQINVFDLHALIEA